jgi:hypothetical protein
MAVEGKGESGSTARAAASGAEPPARPRHRPTAELGRRFAALLGEPHAHQLGVCAKLQLSYATYKRWMAADLNDEADDMEHVQFQAIVYEALERARVADIKKLDEEFGQLDGARVAVAGPLVNKHTFHHQNRFKRFYANDDEPKKTELDIGNKDGKPFSQHHTGPLSEQSRRVIVTEFLGLTPELLDAGARAGDVDMSTATDEDAEENL